MEFIIKCDGRWYETNHEYRQMSFKEILEVFENDGDSGDLDEMIDCVANMDVNEVYSFGFFMNDTYTFKRIS
jgi:hypothetical protein